jgi:hypothetical protein
MTLLFDDTQTESSPDLLKTEKSPALNIPTKETKVRKRSTRKLSSTPQSGSTSQEITKTSTQSPEPSMKKLVFFILKNINTHHIDLSFSNYLSFSSGRKISTKTFAYETSATTIFRIHNWKK